MGIGIDMGTKGLKQDTSFLFQSLSGGNSNLNFLSDYMSIKNGSYGKLMKAYYAKDGASKEVSSIADSKKNSSSKSISTAKDSAQTLSSIESAADGLKDSADKLLTKGSKSVFNKVDVESKDEYGFAKTTKEYDTNAIYSAVSDFVSDYNKLVKEAGSAESSSIGSKLQTMTGLSKANENMLSKVGITINSDNTLSIDEEAFKKADMGTVKSLFNENGSYGYRVSAQASLIDYTAQKEASKANTYNSSGSYSSAYSTGSLYDYGF